MNFNELATEIQDLLNSNSHGVQFEVGTDVDSYDMKRSEVNSFIVPCLLTALPGTYEPLQAIKVQYIPVMIEAFGFVPLASDFGQIPFSVQDQKDCFDELVSAINGATKTIDDDVVIFSGANVTVGNVTNNSGGGYTRLPLLLQMRLTVVGNAVLFNTQTIKIDNIPVFFTSFSVGLVRQGEALTSVGTTVAKTLCKQMSRVFSGTAYLVKGAPLTAIKHEILISTQINAQHILTFDDISYNVVLTEGTIVGRIGAVMEVSMTFAEVF